MAPMPTCTCIYSTAANALLYVFILIVLMLWRHEFRLLLSKFIYFLVFDRIFLSALQRFVSIILAAPSSFANDIRIDDMLPRKTLLGLFLFTLIQLTTGIDTIAVVYVLLEHACLTLDLLGHLLLLLCCVNWMFHFLSKSIWQTAFKSSSKLKF